MANKLLTPASSWDNCYSPINGDPDDQALDEACYQALANRTKFLWDTRKVSHAIFASYSIADAISSATYVASSMTVTLNNLETNNIVLLDWHFYMNPSGCSGPQTALNINGGAFYVNGSEIVYLNFAAAQFICQSALYLVASPGNYTFTLHGLEPTGTLTIDGPAVLRAVALQS